MQLKKWRCWIEVWNSQIEPLKLKPQCVFAPLRETKIHTLNQQRRKNQLKPLTAIIGKSCHWLVNLTSKFG